jgi:hypothetical protein
MDWRVSSLEFQPLDRKVEVRYRLRELWELQGSMKGDKAL